MFSFLMVVRYLTGSILQEGISRLWRGTNAGLALAVPTVSSFLGHTFLIVGFCFFY